MLWYMLLGDEKKSRKQAMNEPMYTIYLITTKKEKRRVKLCFDQYLTMQVNKVQPSCHDTWQFYSIKMLAIGRLEVPVNV